MIIVPSDAPGTDTGVVVPASQLIEDYRSAFLRGDLTALVYRHLGVADAAMLAVEVTQPKDHRDRP